MPLPIPTSRNAIEDIQRARKRVAVEQARRARFFAGKLDDIDLDRLDDWEEWSKIPILEKEDLRALTPTAFMSDFCVAPRSDIAELWRSGGSTGVPLFYPRTYEDMKYALLSFERAFDCAGMGREGSVRPGRAKPGRGRELGRLGRRNALCGASAAHRLSETEHLAWHV